MPISIRSKKKKYALRTKKHKRRIRTGGADPTAVLKFRKNIAIWPRGNSMLHVNKSAVRVTPKSYINSVLFDDTNVPPNLEQLLLTEWGVTSLNDLQKVIDDAINLPFKHSCKTITEWVKCSGDCKSILTNLIKNEIESTAYMIRTIQKSVISIIESQKSPITFTSNNQLTGTWDTDYQSITLQFAESNQLQRLIMGFGPSASGKTYWAKNIIKLCSKSDEKFPKTFLSIDGGLYRESSIVYQMILSAINKTCYKGFSNLVDDMGFGSMFESGIIKKKMVAYLQKYKGNVSLYVPETLGGCDFVGNRIKKCFNSYKDYIDITRDDNWIGLLIWQHRTGSDCKENFKFKCKGCAESGAAREGGEGKKYSPGAHGWSLDNGLNHIGINPKLYNTPNERSVVIKGTTKARGGRFIIHNSGGASHMGNNGQKINNKTTIEDLSDDHNNPISVELRNEQNTVKYNYRLCHTKCIN